MLDVLLLRFDAPLQSFGGPAVDAHGVIDAHPGVSLLAGLLGNALGYQHQESSRLNALQARLRYAARCDRPGQRITDFQTVDLGQDFLVDAGWTTRGLREDREGGSAREATHIRYRDYWADSVHTVALCLDRPNELPDIASLERALKEPARPLFLGRKCCLPAAPLLLGRTSATSLFAAIAVAPRLAEGRSATSSEETLSAVWPADEDFDPARSRLVAVVDERDFENQIHVGRRLMRQGSVRLEEKPQ